jgi:cell filamentation protein, protein adenylyltransferase
MGYDIADDPYMDPKTGILKNKLGAKTQPQLDTVEAEITYLIIATLTRGSEVDSLLFNTELLLDIHKEIFGEIYAWAGSIRTHDISKDWAYFCHAEFINNELKQFSRELQADVLLLTDDVSVFAKRIAHYYDLLNAIHPFREGNGRVVRTFLRLLALKHGFDIEWGRLDPNQNIEASKQAMKGNPQLMQDMIKRLVVKVQ